MMSYEAINFRGATANDAPPKQSHTNEIHPSAKTNHSMLIAFFFSPFDNQNYNRKRWLEFGEQNGHFAG